MSLSDFRKLFFDFAPIFVSAIESIPRGFQSQTKTQNLLQMKSLLIIISFIMTASLSIGQDLILEVIAAEGTIMTASNGMDLHWTLGETVVEHFQNGTTLSQGFHQNFDFATPVFETPYQNIEIKVYPNPATEWIAIEADSPENLEYRLYDLHGRTLLTSTLTNQMEQLNIKSLPGGTYLLNVSGEHGLIQTFKIIVTE